MMKIEFSMGLFASLFLSIPFYFLWNLLAPIYLRQLPPVYLDIPFWHCVGIFVLIWILRVMLLPSGWLMLGRHRGNGAGHGWKK